MLRYLIIDRLIFIKIMDNGYRYLGIHRIWVRVQVQTFGPTRVWTRIRRFFPKRGYGDEYYSMMPTAIPKCES